MRWRFAGSRAHWRWKEQLQGARAQPAVAPLSRQTAHLMREPRLCSLCGRAGGCARAHGRLRTRGGCGEQDESRSAARGRCGLMRPPPRPAPPRAMMQSASNFRSSPALPLQYSTQIWCAASTVLSGRAGGVASREGRRRFAHGRQPPPRRLPAEVKGRGGIAGQSRHEAGGRTLANHDHAVVDRGPRVGEAQAPAEAADERRAAARVADEARRAAPPLHACAAEVWRRCFGER